MRYILLVASLMLLLVMPILGASSFLGGYSGNIITPDAVIVPSGTWEVSYHTFLEILGDDDLNAFGITYGAIPNLELGVSFVSNGESDTAINAKYMLVPETANRPSVIVGVFDLAGSADSLSDDPGMYVVISKNITGFASEVAGEPSKPLRLSAGIGSGVFDGFFAGLDWTLTPQLSLMAEFFGGEFEGEDNFFNAGIRYSVTDALRVDAAAIDFDNLALGANYRITF